MSVNSYHAFVPGDALLTQVKAGSIREKAKLYKGDISNIKFNTYLYLYVCVIGVVRRFQPYFSHITTVAARVLSAANTDAPCLRHETQMHHTVTLS